MNFSLSYPRLKLAVPPTLVRVDLPAQGAFQVRLLQTLPNPVFLPETMCPPRFLVLRSSLTNALTEPVFSTFKVRSHLPKACRVFQVLRPSSWASGRPLRLPARSTDLEVSIQYSIRICLNFSIRRTCALSDLCPTKLQIRV